MFAPAMISILMKRFGEIHNRKIMGIKAKWFKPLNKVELEKLGVNLKKDKNLSL